MTVPSPTPNTRGLLMQTLFGIAWMMGGNFARHAQKLVIFAVLARLLTLSDFGIYAAMLVVLNFAEIFIKMGLGPAIIQRKDLSSSHLTAGLISSVLLGIAMTLSVGFASASLASMFGVPEMRQLLEVSCPIFFVRALSIVPYSLLIRNMRFATVAKIQTASFFAGFFIVALWLGVSGSGYWALAIGYFTQIGLATLLYSVVQKCNYSTTFCWLSFKQLFHVSAGVSLAHVGTTLGRNGDSMVTSMYLGEAALGLYSRAYGIVEATIGAFATAAKQVLLPAFATIQDDNARLRDAMRKNLRVVFSIYIIISVLFLIAAEEIVLVLLGTKWSDAVAPLQILSIGTCFRAGVKVTNPIMVAKARTFRAAGCQLFYAATVICGAWTGAGHGINGVACGVVTAMALTFLLSQWLVSTLIGFTWKEYPPAIARWLVILLTVGPIAWLTHMATAAWINYHAITLASTLVVGLGSAALLILLKPKTLLDEASLTRLHQAAKGASPKRPRLASFLLQFPLFHQNTNPAHPANPNPFEPT